jgi:hypothetical protein
MQCIDVGEIRNVVARTQRAGGRCLHLAEQAKSERDREFFIELGRTWCEFMEEIESETAPPH